MKGGSDVPSVQASARAYLRAVAGGLLVGLPLLFTMEIWWNAFLLPWWKILLLLALSFVIVVGYTAIAGFREDRGVLEILIDAVEALGIGIGVALLILLILQRIELLTSPRDAAGKVALEAIPIAFGAAVASAQLGRQDEEAANQSRRRLPPLARLFVAAGGALLFALNVAPTEEPMLLGIEADWWLLLLAMAASYLLTLAIVFYADFRGGISPVREDGALSTPFGETTAAYALSLLVSLVLLWFFGRTEGFGLRPVLGQTVMLAMVASFGAAAGRLLIGGDRG